MARLEEDVVRPYHPPFYDRYVDDCFSKKVENETDRLLDIKFTDEEKPNHFLNTVYNYQYQNFHRRVYRKQGNVLIHCSSQVPSNWKRNRMMGALHRAKRISTSSESDMKEITEIYRKAGYPISASFKPQSTVSVTKQTRTRVLSQSKGRTREQVSSLRASPSPRKTSNQRINMKHCVHRENHLLEENIMDGLLIACEKPTPNKQVHSFIAKLFTLRITSSNKTKLYVNFHHVRH